LAPRENSIEAHGLVREFKKGPRAVDGIDLRVDPGEIYGFLGPNGAVFFWQTAVVQSCAGRSWHALADSGRSRDRPTLRRRRGERRT
jgi:ABC-type lipopolysaccharide export system ATPase subunit